MNNVIPIVQHPLQPFLPHNARILMLGSFPPKHEKWCMEWFYPNWINDMWRIMGYVFYHNKNHFVVKNIDGSVEKRFDRISIMDFCSEKGIAIFDTACKVRRLKDNASDKFLEVVEKTDIAAMIEQLPYCTAVVTTGQKATDVVVDSYKCNEPSTGSWSEVLICQRKLRFWRMPSTSRAYYLSLDKKAGFYEKMFEYEGLL